MAQNSPFLLTLEAALYVGLTPVTLDKLRLTGGGPPFYRVGSKRVVYDRADLEAWVRSNKFDSTSERLADAVSAAASIERIGPEAA
jgi:hypothetical protein